MRYFYRAGEFEMSLLLELWAFLRERKKFWLLPIVVVMLLFGMLLVFAESSALAPFIYTLF
jgi:drug/metabolite transporter superfamily protein YnfA